MNSDVCNDQLNRIKLWNYKLVWLIHITSMHISFGKLYAYKLSPLQAALFNEDKTCWKSKSMCMVATLTGKSMDIYMYIMFCPFSFLFSSTNLISLWAHWFPCGLLKFLVQGPTWPLENFTKLHPCKLWPRLKFLSTEDNKNNNNAPAMTFCQGKLKTKGPNTCSLPVTSKNHTRRRTYQQAAVTLHSLMNLK